MKKEIETEAKEIIGNKNIIDALFNLKGRWQDESEYEDFNDYIVVIKDIVNKQGYTFIKLTKTFVLTLTGKFATYCVKIKGYSISISLSK